MSEKRNLIEITELRAIGSDQNGWMVLKRTKKKDKATGKATGGYSSWVSYKYPDNLKKCAAYIEGEMIRTAGATTLTELHRAAERIHAMMLEILEKAEVPHVRP